MSKTRLVLALLLIIASPAAADIFKCTRPGGEVFFTDSPTQSSGECLLHKVSAPPPDSIAPVSSQPQPPLPVAKSSDVPQVDTDTATYDALNSEAQQLVDRFADARRRSIRYSLVIQKQKAQREMTEIRMEKTTLLGKIEQSAVSVSEKQELTGRLAPITE